MNNPEWKLTHIPRPIRFLEIFNHKDWKIKIYGISQANDNVSFSFLAHARGKIINSLPLSAITAARYGQAFAIIHEASVFNQIVVCWWENTNELRQRIFRTSPEDKLEYFDITGTEGSLCLWELRIISFERDMWLSYVLISPDPNRIQVYMRRTFSVIE